MDLNKVYSKIKSIDDKELKDMIMDLIDENKELNNDLNIDSLTGAYNRRVLDNISDNCCIAMCDIDFFKEKNDSYGHDYGDKILKRFYTLSKSLVRREDIICRYGGDEFVIILKSCPVQVALMRLTNIKKRMEKENITVSIGLSEYKDGKTLDEAIKEADEALYISKNNGKNQVTVFNSMKYHSNKR